MTEWKEAGTRSQGTFISIPDSATTSVVAWGQSLPLPKKKRELERVDFKGPIHLNKCVTFYEATDHILFVFVSPASGTEPSTW